jgi:hypothetical protein
MSVLPEVIVVTIYMVEGFRLERLPKDQRCKKSRKRIGWPSGVAPGQELLDDNASASQPDSEAEVWKSIDYGSSGTSLS